MPRLNLFLDFSEFFCAQSNSTWVKSHLRWNYLLHLTLLLISCGLNLVCERWDWATKGILHSYIFYIFTARKRSLRRLCFHRCLSVHGEGCLPHCMLGYTPPDQRQKPPQDQTPPEQTPPTVHAGRYGQQAGGTHPTGMHTCLALSTGRFFINWWSLVLNPLQQLLNGSANG